MKEYRLLDFGSGRKLEDVGGVVLIRPALNAFRQCSLPQAEWDKAVAEYRRDSSGSGKWLFRNRNTLKNEWVISHGGFALRVRPTDFGHLGFFAEQHDNWQWQQQQIKRLAAGEFKALNLFAYSGIGSLAMAQAGAKVCHVDAARGMNEWGQQNLALNPHIPGNIRWITDDVKKFLGREVKRCNKYQAIVFDPPSFGRGNKGQVWKITEDISPFLDTCFRLLDEKNDCIMLFSCHSPGFSPLVLKSLLLDAAVRFKFSISCEQCGEMTVPQVKSTSLLPAGNYCRVILRKM